MKFKQLLTEDDGVSPVIGVILMVAITVILAAVIASFVLGLGDTGDDIQPNTNFNLEHDAINEDFEDYFHDGTDVRADWLHQNTSYSQADNNWHENAAGTEPDAVTPDENSNGFLTITISDGESVEASEMYLRGEGLYAIVEDDDNDFVMTDVDELAWEDLGDVDADEEFSAGQSITVVVQGDFDVNVVWEATDSDSSSTLAEREGPDA